MAFLVAVTRASVVVAKPSLLLVSNSASHQKKCTGFVRLPSTESSRGCKDSGHNSGVWCRRHFRHMSCHIYHDTTYDCSERGQVAAADTTSDNDHAIIRIRGQSLDTTRVDASRRPLADGARCA